MTWSRDSVVRESFVLSLVIMVACGKDHTLLLTTGGAWTCGWGHVSQLGHGDEADKLVLTLVTAEWFEGDTIVMVAGGMCNSEALRADGRVWTWGWSFSRCLGHNDEEDRLVPTHLGGAMAGAAEVLVRAGVSNTLAVTIDGVLWAWDSVLWAWGSGGG